MAGLRFGVIGCGAISEAFYLPVLSAKRSICSELHLVDTEPRRLAAMARQFGATTTASSLNDVLDQIDAAVIATPHASHFPIASTLIAAGRHVFCEKPLTLHAADAEELVRAASAAKVVLMTNNFRRDFAAFRGIADIIRRGELGRPLAATWTEGAKFAWPTQSGFYFTQLGAGGLPPPGVLLDIGAHVVDVLCWWFGDAPHVIECRTDSFGGPEGRARLTLGFAGMRAEIDLSYYQRMANSYSLTFERGSISGVTNESYRFQLLREGARPVTVSIRSGRVDVEKHWSRMLSNFVAVVHGSDRPMITGHDVVPSIRAIEEAYRAAKPFDAPWLPRWAHEATA